MSIRKMSGHLSQQYILYPAWTSPGLWITTPELSGSTFSEVTDVYGSDLSFSSLSSRSASVSSSGLAAGAAMKRRRGRRAASRPRP